MAKKVAKVAPKKGGRHPKVTPEQVIEALEKAHGIQAQAALNLGVNRKTIANYIEKDAKVKEAYEQVNEATIDFAESQLFRAMGENNITAIIFFLKTKAQHRGYIEKQHLDVTSGGEKLGIDGKAIDRAVSTLSDALRESLSGESSK